MISGAIELNLCLQPTRANYINGLYVPFLHKSFWNTSSVFGPSSLFFPYVILDRFWRVFSSEIIFSSNAEKSSSNKLLFEKQTSFTSYPINLKLYPRAAACYGVTIVFMRAKRSFLILFWITRDGFGTAFYLKQALTKSFVMSVWLCSLFGLKTPLTSVWRKLCFIVLYISESIYLVLSLITFFCYWEISCWSCLFISSSLSTSSLISL